MQRTDQESLEDGQESSASVSGFLSNCEWDKYLAASYTILLLLSVLLGVLLLLYTDDFIVLVCFGVCALILACVAVLLSTWSNDRRYDDSYLAKELQNSCSNLWIEFLRRDQNAIKIFMVVEALLDVYFGATVVQEENVTSEETDVAALAIGSAASAILLILLSVMLMETVYKVKREGDVELDDARKRKRSIFVYGVDSFFTIAIVLNDLADVLLLSRALVTEAFGIKEQVLFVFLVANVFIAEAAVLLSYFTEAWTDDEVGKEFKGSVAPSQLAQFQRAGRVARASRRKTRAQVSFTGLLVIPLVLSFGVLRDALSAAEQAAIALLCLTSIPVFLTLGTDKFYFYVVPRTPFQLQELAPKLVALVFIGTYAGVDELFPSLDAASQQLTFVLHFAYIALPLCFRMTIDFYRYWWLKYHLSKELADFEEHPLTNFDFLCLSLLLPKSEQLKKLVLANTNLTRVGTRAISRGLKTNGWLKELGLSCNEIGSEGAKVLSDGLQENTTLTTLDLSDNEIRNAGAVSIGAALENNKTLTTLDLSVNEIKDDGAAALGHALQENTTLTHLDLSNNKIENAGAESIGAALENNETLTHLDLQDNKIDPNVKQRLRDHLQYCDVTI